MDRKEEMEAKQRRMLQNVEELAEMGGFIKEAIGSRVFELYPREVIGCTDKYGELGKGYIQVAEAVLSMFNDPVFYDEINADIEDMEDVEKAIQEMERQEKEIEYARWCMDHIARCAWERIRAGGSRFWEEWGLSPHSKRALGHLSALEERVLYLMFGLDGSRCRTPGEVSAFKEFGCDSEWIERCFEHIQSIFESYSNGMGEFEQRAKEYRASAAAEKGEWRNDGFDMSC